MIKTNNKERINWIDVLKGFGIILVVYGHNYPFLETYIYSFHMPLFFFLAGIFHPKRINFSVIKKRAFQILIPYFFWSTFLFLFWFFIGRKFGDSANLGLSVFKNFTGILFAQGGHEYMNWGLQMWFLPAIFFTFLFFGFILKIIKESYQILCLIALIILGFLIPKVFHIHVIWSLDVALVSLFFYALAYYFRELFLDKKYKYETIILFFLFIIHLICSLNLNVKVDMYRSIYGNEFLFLFNGTIGISFWMLFFKRFQKIPILGFLGKNTIPILALHIRSLTFIKLLLLVFLGAKNFSFSELEKIILVVIQLIILYPIILIINKKLPILNGKKKTFETRT
ncbi:acyltransferase family protein [Polaribacter aquimarinus]|uniref:Acyltransferase 3 domain-containing protein n=1 Tax=Polaribacter aquimarinus TaxID=2100726 RepID=A0A2U2JBB9_9FLAO|nr:acyltransferase family protein [Polaribacter aquimarinus]PWG05636.1 hypothetical protein DIS07_04110 [Polaribacter aquimarinus]